MNHLSKQQLKDLFQYIQDDLDQCEKLEIEPSLNLLEIQKTIEKMLFQES